MFVAGWRPFTGWICASALAYVDSKMELLLYCIVLAMTIAYPI